MVLRRVGVHAAKSANLLTGVVERRLKTARPSKCPAKHTAAVLGGFGSIPGAIVAALIVGVSEMFVGFYISTKAIDVSTFIIIIAVLLLRPKGLFGVAAVKRL